MTRDRVKRLVMAGTLGVASAALVLVLMEWRAPVPEADAPPLETAPSPEAVTVVARIEDESSSKPAAHATVPTSLPDSGLTGAEAVAVLHPLAQAGQRQAMSRMALHLLNCAKWIGTSDEKFQEIELSNFRSEFNRNPEGDEEVGKVAADTERDIRYRDDCQKIDGDLMANRVGWLEKAARAGDPTARRDYVRWGLQDFPGREDILMNFEEVQRRRELAREFLLQSIAAGDCKALYPLAEAYSGAPGVFDWIVAQDPVRSWAYGTAAMRKQSLGNDEMAWIARRNAMYAAAFDAAQRDAANRMSRSFANCGP